MSENGKCRVCKREFPRTKLCGVGKVDENFVYECNEKDCYSISKQSSKQSSLKKENKHFGQEMLKNELFISIGLNNVEINTSMYKTSGNKLSSIFKLLDQKENIEQFSHQDIEFITDDSVSNNYFMQSLFLAFSGHYPVIITPDHIWTCILQGLAKHMNTGDNAEKYRKSFVNFEGQTHLIYRNDSFRMGQKNDWCLVAEEFVKLMDITPEKKKILVDPYSTTTPLIQSVYNSSMMNIVQKYFKYTLMTMCGIPVIKLYGKIDDWKQMKIRIQFLRELGLKEWVDELEKIIDKIIKTFEEPILTEEIQEFWTGMFKYNDGRGSGQVAHITGWINTLFPYTNDVYKICNKKLEPKNCQLGISSTPFIWDYLGTEFSMNYISGFVGVTQEKDGTLMSEIGHVISNNGIINDDD